MYANISLAKTISNVTKIYLKSNVVVNLENGEVYTQMIDFQVFNRLVEALNK